MPLPVITGFRTVSTFSNIGSGVPWSVTFDYRHTLQTGGLSAQNVADHMLTRWIAFYNTITTGTNQLRLNVNPDVDLQSIKVYDLRLDAGPDGEWVGTESIGTGTGGPLPPDMALCLTKRTGQRGRRGRGRAYFGGWQNSAVTADGFVTDSVATAVAAAATAQLLELNPAIGDELSMVVISQFARGPVVPPLLPPGPILPTDDFPVLSLTCDVQWDVQRRRGQG